MIGILDTGGNYGSLLSAFERTGHEAHVVVHADMNPESVFNRFVIPGVGHAGRVMDRLKFLGMDTAIPKLTVPVLGICVGFHVMCRYSEEGDTQCMGIFPVDVRKGRVRHGWAELRGLGWFFYTHGYQVSVDGTPTGIMSRDNFLGVQGHPEKSSTTGIEFLRRWASGELEE